MFPISIPLLILCFMFVIAERGWSAFLCCRVQPSNCWSSLQPVFVIKMWKITVLYKFIAWNQIKLFRSTHLSTMSIFLRLGKMRVVLCHAISCLVNIYLPSSICAQSSHKDVQRIREAEIIQRFLFFLKCLKWNVWKRIWRSLMKNMKKLFIGFSTDDSDPNNFFFI